MFSYTVCMNYDEVEFNRQCSNLEKKIIGIKPIYSSIIDEDGSQWKKYDVNGAEIRIENSFSIDAIFIDSEIDLVDIVESKL